MKVEEKNSKKSKKVKGWQGYVCYFSVTLYIIHYVVTVSTMFWSGVALILVLLMVLYIWFRWSHRDLLRAVAHLPTTHRSWPIFGQSYAAFGGREGNLHHNTLKYEWTTFKGVGLCYFSDKKSFLYSVIVESKMKFISIVIKVHTMSMKSSLLTKQCEVLVLTSFRHGCLTITATSLDRLLKAST